MSDEAETDRLLHFFYGSKPMFVNLRWEHVIRDIREPFFRQAVVAFWNRTAELPGNELESWFGRVEVGLPGETWPEWNGKPMVPLLQLNCAELPVSVEEFAGIEALTLFGTRFTRYGYNLLENGAGWTIRSYASRSDLVHLRVPQHDLNDSAKPFRIVWEQVLDDLPYKYSEGFRETIQREFSDRIYPLYLAEGGTYDRDDFEEYLYFHFDAIDELLPHHEDLKILGWPTTPSKNYTFPEPPSNYRYVFEIPMMVGFGWEWRRESGSTTALFYRNMDSPEPEWGMFLRPSI